MPNSVQVRFNSDKKHVLYINSTIDAYDGIGIVRTIDRDTGYITIYSTDGMVKYVLNLLESLKKEGIPINNLQVIETEEIEI
jgi:hypothetical protein